MLDLVDTSVTKALDLHAETKGVTSRCALMVSCSQTALRSTIVIKLTSPWCRNRH